MQSPERAIRRRLRVRGRPAMNRRAPPAPFHRSCCRSLPDRFDCGGTDAAHDVWSGPRTHGTGGGAQPARVRYRCGYPRAVGFSGQTNGRRRHGYLGHDGHFLRSGGRCATGRRRRPGGNRGPHAGRAFRTNYYCGASSHHRPRRTPASPPTRLPQLRIRTARLSACDHHRHCAGGGEPAEERSHRTEAGGFDPHRASDVFTFRRRRVQRVESDRFPRLGHRGVPRLFQFPSAIPRGPHRYQPTG